MRIAQFARATHLSRETIRFDGPQRLLRPQILSNRYQDFDAEQVDQAPLIRGHPMVGFTRREIAALGEQFSSGISLRRQAQVMRKRLAAIEETDGSLAMLATRLAAQDRSRSRRRSPSASAAN